MLNKLKEVSKIRICREEDREKLVAFLNESPVFHTFLLADIEQYGFDEEFQKVYVQENQNEIEGVFLKYFNNFILAGKPEKLDYSKIASLIDSEITTVMGNAELVERTVKNLECSVKLVRNNLYVHQPLEAYEGLEKIKVANLADVEKIYDFLMTFPEFKEIYAAKQMIINRIEKKEGVHLYLEQDHEIIAHGNSAASADKTCMIGGICVRKKDQHKGYAKIILRALCKHIEQNQKIPCIFASEKENYSIFDELNFKNYGKWGVAQITRGEK